MGVTQLKIAQYSVPWREPALPAKPSAAKPRRPSCVCVCCVCAHPSFRGESTSFPNKASIFHTTIPVYDSTVPHNEHPLQAVRVTPAHHSPLIYATEVRERVVLCCCCATTRLACRAKRLGPRDVIAEQWGRMLPW